MFCLYFLPDLSSLLLRKPAEVYQALAVLCLLDIWDVGLNMLLDSILDMFRKWESYSTCVMPGNK